MTQQSTTKYLHDEGFQDLKHFQRVTFQGAFQQAKKLIKNRENKTKKFNKSLSQEHF